MSASGTMKLNPAEVQFIDNVYRQYSLDIYRYLRVYIRRAADDEIYDCVQDTFLNAMKRIKEFLYVSNIAGWIYRTAIYTAKNYTRKRSVELARIIYRDILETDLVDTDSAEDVFINNLEPSAEVFYDAMHDMYKSFSPDEARVYSCIMHRMSCYQMAEILDMDLNRVYYLHRNVEKRIRACIKKIFQQIS